MIGAYKKMWEDAEQENRNHCDKIAALMTQLDERQHQVDMGTQSLCMSSEIVISQRKTIAELKEQLNTANKMIARLNREKKEKTHD